VRVRVHLYERALPAKPVRRCDGWNEPRAQSTSKGRRTRQCHRHGAVSPDDRDMHVGRERPPAGRASGEAGGSRMGVAHAPAVALLGCDSWRTPIPAAQSAAGSGSEVADWQEHERSFSCTRRARRVLGAQAVGSSDGNGAPEFRFPHLVPPTQVQTSVTRKGRRDAVTLGPMVPRKTVRPPERQHSDAGPCLVAR
jgi:hypothetical protein